MKLFFILIFLVSTCALLAFDDLDQGMGVFGQIGEDVSVLCPERLEIKKVVCDQENENGEIGILVRQIRNDAWGRTYPSEVMEKSDVRFCQINGNKIKTKYRHSGNFWGPNNMDYVTQSWLISSDDKVSLQKVTKWTERSYLRKISAGMEVIMLNFPKNNLSQIDQVHLSLQGIWYDLNKTGRDYVSLTDCHFKRI